MASGKTHALVSLVSGLALAVALDPATGAGCILGSIITPDLDYIDEYDIFSGKLITRIAGKVHAIGDLWRLYWFGYGRLFPHRSFWSHAPFIGTAIRVIYILLWPSLIYVLWYFTFERAIILEAVRAYLDVLKAMISTPIYRQLFAGLCISDTLHLIFDFTFWRHTNDHNHSARGRFDNGKSFIR